MIKTKTLIQQVLILLILVFSIVSSVGGAFTVYAAPSGVAAFEQQTALEDLEGSTLNGKTFSQEDYQPSSIKNLQLINFLEYGFFKESKAYYNLYFYIYNPQELELNLNSLQNQIQFRVGGDNTTNYFKYDIQLLNVSGVLYKFKVILTSSQRSAILSTLNASSRIYEVSGVELLENGATNAKDYDVSKKYTYTGEGESLSCSSEGTITLSLDVNAANYRADGSNGDNNYTQDTLHSVYFSIPDDIIDDYGDITAIHARWLNATTVPMLVLGDKAWSDPYSSITNVHYDGQSWYDVFYNNAISYYGDYATNPYLVFTNLKKIDFGFSNKTYGEAYKCDYVYNKGKYLPDDNCVHDLQQINKTTINHLPIVLKATGNASEYTASTDELINYFSNYVDDACDGIGEVADKYSHWCFDSYDKEYTDMTIKSDETFKLTSQKIGQHWWEKAFGWEGTNTITNEEFEVQAIQKVSSSDLKSTTAETSKNLLIGEWDVENFTSYFNAARAKDKSESTYLFRYYQSKYFSQNAAIMNRGKSNAFFGYYQLETVYDNAYLAQEEVQLNFDVIDITMTKGDVVTVIGVVATPLDNFAPVTPPLVYFENNFWKFALALIAVLVVILVVVIIIEKQTKSLEDMNYPSSHYKKE